MLENRFIIFLMERIEEEVGELPESQTQVNLVMFTKELRGALDVLLKSETKTQPPAQKTVKRNRQQEETRADTE